MRLSPVPARSSTKSLLPHRTQWIPNCGSFTAAQHEQYQYLTSMMLFIVDRYFWLLCRRYHLPWLSSVLLARSVRMSLGGSDSPIIASPTASCTKKSGSFQEAVGFSIVAYACYRLSSPRKSSSSLASASAAPSMLVLVLARHSLSGSVLCCEAPRVCVLSKLLHIVISAMQAER